MTTKRVYHPTLNAWQDVDASTVDSWAEAGWRKTAPKHVDDSDAPAVGEHPGFAQIPVLEDLSTTTTGTATTATTGTAGSTT